MYLLSFLHSSKIIGHICFCPGEFFDQPEWKKDPRKAATASLQTQVMDHLTLKSVGAKIQNTKTKYKYSARTEVANLSTGKNTEKIHYDHYQPVLNASLKLGEG